MSKQNEGSAAIHNAVSQLLIDGNVKGALALANCLHAPGRSITASAATSPKREKKVVIKTTKAKAKAKAKAKPKRYTHAHKDVKLTTQQWAVWVAVKALLNAKGELASEGFYSLSGQFVAQFIGLPYWEKREVNRVNSAMACLRRKGLLTWVNEKIGKRGHKSKGGIALGPKA
jgi:NACalpha-BTF3-like transcription factor